MKELDVHRMTMQYFLRLLNFERFSKRIPKHTKCITIKLNLYFIIFYLHLFLEKGSRLRVLYDLCKLSVYFTCKSMAMNGSVLYLLVDERTMKKCKTLLY